MTFDEFMETTNYGLDLVLVIGFGIVCILMLPLLLPFYLIGWFRKKVKK